jgi:hypothetical protein
MAWRRFSLKKLLQRFRMFMAPKEVPAGTPSTFRLITILVKAGKRAIQAGGDYIRGIMAR